MHEKLISIIIPVHNGEEYIVQLIERILNNPYKNVEILIGDDASSDRTQLLLNQFTNNPKVQLFFSKENIGPGALRNKLLKIAKGDFLALQDADDSFQNERFLKQIEFLKENSDVGAVGTGAQLISIKDGGQWGKIERKESPTLFDWISQSSVVHASLMLRRELKLLATYREDLEVGEDYYFLTELFCKGVKFKNLREPLYCYYVEEKDLRTRAHRKFFKILKSIFSISNLFPFHLKVIFLFINLAKLSIGYLRGFWRGM